MSTTRTENSPVHAPEEAIGLHDTADETEGQKAVRYVLPALLVVAGIVVLVVGGGGLFPTAVGVLLVVGAVAMFVADRLVRLTVSSEDDRVAEQQRRRRFSRTGRW